MPESWWFELQGPEPKLWTWWHVDAGGQVLQKSDMAFDYYLAPMADANQHGFAGCANFGSPLRPVTTHNHGVQPS